MQHRARGDIVDRVAVFIFNLDGGEGLGRAVLEGGKRNIAGAAQGFMADRDQVAALQAFVIANQDLSLPDMKIVMAHHTPRPFAQWGGNTVHMGTKSAACCELAETVPGNARNNVAFEPQRNSCVIAHWPEGNE